MWIVRLEGFTNHFQIILILKALFSVLITTSSNNSFYIVSYIAAGMVHCKFGIIHFCLIFLLRTICLDVV